MKKIVTATILLNDIQSLIENAQDKAIRAIDTQRVMLYWKIGQRIYEELQDGKDRADYGKQLLKTLSSDIGACRI